jgi:glycosyltransferase involved in cell wall biosynthesis
LKALIIGSRVPFPLRDGGAIATYNLLKGLSEQGLSVDFISLNTSKHFIEESIVQKEFSFLNHVETFFINTDIKAIKAFMNLFQSGSYNVDRFTDGRFAEKIQALCDRNQYDIIHFEGLFVAQYLPLIKTPAIKILRQHNIEFKIWQTLASTKKGLKRRYIQLLADRLEQFEKTITPKFDALVSITEADRIDSIQELKFPKISATIPAGIAFAKSVSNTVNPSYLYHIGSMEWMPNMEAMEWFNNDIWPIIEKHSNTAEFFMAGKHMPERYKQWATSRFHVDGEVESLEQFSSDKAILTVPLRSGSGIRIKTIEAMMSGKAVVTTAQGAQGLDIKDGEHCLIANEAQTFAQACIQLLENTELRKHIAQNGQRYAESHFGNEAVSRVWHEFYATLIKQ